MTKPGDSVGILIEQIISSAGPKAEAVCAGPMESDKRHEPLTLATAADTLACVAAVDLGFLGKAYDAVTGAHGAPLDTPKAHPQSSPAPKK